MDPEHARLTLGLVSLNNQLMNANTDLSVTASEIRDLEVSAVSLIDQMTLLSEELGLPDLVLGDAAPRASFGFGVLMCLLARITDENSDVTQEEIQSRIISVRSWYRVCAEQNPTLHAERSGFLGPYRQRIEDLDLIEASLSELFKTRHPQEKRRRWF